MRVDVIELLRCPRPHAQSPLITVADRRDGDNLLDGTLGCVVCGAEYALRDGVAHLGGEVSPEVLVDADMAASVSPPDPLRVAALLGLSDVTTRGVLCGALASACGPIEELTGARCLAVNPLVASNQSPDALAANGVPATDTILLDGYGLLPLPNGSLQGLAVDVVHHALLADATRAVRRGGRVVGPVSVAVPAGCRELARDDAEWVAEVETTSSEPVRISRAR